MPAVIDPVLKAIDYVLMPMGFTHARIVGATRGYTRVSDKGTEAVLITSIQVVPSIERISVRAAVRIDEIEQLLRPLRKGLERLLESVFTVACPLYLIDARLPMFWMIDSEASAEKVSREIALVIQSTVTSYFKSAMDLDALHEALRRAPRAVAGHVDEVQIAAVLLAISKLRGDGETARQLVQRLEEIPRNESVYLKKVRLLAKGLF
jgi:hypothetical protein